MTRPTEAQHSLPKATPAFATPDFAEVQRTIDVAKRLRAEAMAGMIRAAVRALSRVLLPTPAAKRGGPRTA